MSLGMKFFLVVVVFLFSGFNYLSLEVLKLDMVVLGVNMFVVWINMFGLLSLVMDKWIVNFNILFGILMFCLYVSGIVVLMKVSYLDWSFVVMKFVIMIMVYIYDNNYNFLSDVFMGLFLILYDYGVGYMNLLKVLNFGLVYDFEL